MVDAVFPREAVLHLFRLSRSREGGGIVVIFGFSKLLPYFVARNSSETNVTFR